MADAGLIKRFYEEVIIGGNLSLVDELTAEDLVDHEEGLPGQPPGREGVKFFVNAMRQAFPDLRLTTLDPTMTDGDLEAARTILSGTHTGEFMGIPASGSTVEFESIDIIRLSDGKVDLADARRGDVGALGEVPQPGRGGPRGTGRRRGRGRALGPDLALGPGPGGGPARRGRGALGVERQGPGGRTAIGSRAPRGARARQIVRSVTMLALPFAGRKNP